LQTEPQITNDLFSSVFIVITLEHKHCDAKCGIFLQLKNKNANNS